MPKEKERIVQAELSQDPETGEWIARSLEGPRLIARAIEVRRAKAWLARQLEEKLGQPIQLVEKVKLPKDLAKRVAAFQAAMAEVKRLEDEIEETKLPLIKDLLLYRLQHQQVASLLGISKQWLGQQLKAEATGSYRDTPQRRWGGE